MRQWKDSEDHRPILLRGARQVGKTTLVRQFGKGFDYFLEFNLEELDDKAFFKTHNTAKKLIPALKLQYEIKEDATVLIFIDEIQELPRMIQELRFFYEYFPDTYVIAAGSLLEFAFGDVVSFPVGRIRLMELYPLTFKEFLIANGNKRIVEAYDEVPYNPIAYNLLLDLFHQYVLVGGMPKAVNTYFNGAGLSALPRIYQSIWDTFQLDIERYAKNDTERNVLRHIFQTSPFEADRIKFAGFGNSDYKSREVGEAFRALDLTRVIQLQYPTTSSEVPVYTDFKKHPRLQFLDVGLLNYAMGIQTELLEVKDLNSLYRGKLIQQIVTQEVMALGTNKRSVPHFWVREKKTSNAEVDLVFPYQNQLYPVEVKSGAKGRLRSLHQFVKASPHQYGIRLLANELLIESSETQTGEPYKLMSLPYFLAGKLGKYIPYFTGMSES
ncbi:MAG: AAA family ATPase [Bacteroidota bacterium]